ncbi:MAG TPA: radical SAM protein [Phycisphaerae bacterium]|nr:radical SAM protein [Phycisphaerae bacterium]
MKVIAAIDADLEATPLGLPSRQAHELQGVPVLRRTVERVAQAQQPDGIYVVCPSDQADRCRALLNGTKATVSPRAPGDPPYRRLMRTARKWSLDGWRGGLGGASYIDETVHTAALAALARQTSADAVWATGGAAALIDPAVIDAMIRHYESTARELRFCFAPVPPGMVGTIFEARLLAELGSQGIPPGWVQSYKPGAPQIDLAFKDCCFPCPEAMRHAAGRLVADTRRGTETILAAMTECPDTGAETVGRWLIERAKTQVPPLPREVEIELTTEDQVADTILRPRGERVGRRGPIDPAVVAALAEQLGEYDDSLVVLGGFGEPLLHPEFDRISGLFREAGVFGLAVRTNGLALDRGMIDTLIRHRVDVLEVMLDAWSEELYRKLHPGKELSTVTTALETLSAVKADAKQVEPLVIPQITKSVETVQEIDEFFDGWIRREGWAVIEGYSHYAGQLEDRSVIDMSPPTRAPCRRICTRCLILADGRMTRCDQDFTARTVVGSLHDSSLAALWQSPAMQTARAHHTAARYDKLPLCPTCNEWHRP